MLEPNNVLPFRTVAFAPCPHCRRDVTIQRRDAATVEQARAIICDLVRALRQLAPAHPVLDSLGVFAEVGE